MSDFIFNGQAHGSVAKRLMESNFNIGALRPWVDESGRGLITVNGKNYNNATGVLQYDEWKHFDEAVLRAARIRLTGVNDLFAANLTYSLNGMAKSVLVGQKMSDSMEAQMDMDGATPGKRDRPQFDIGYLPLPITHADFQLNLRTLNESRNGNTPLDVEMAEQAGRRVAEKIEQTLFNGASTYTFGGGAIYGYTDFPYRNSYTLNAHWNDSGATGETILDDVNSMIQMAIDDRMYGPFGLYIPTNFQTAINNDFKSASDKSIRSRLMELDGLNFIKVSDKLTSDNVVLVNMSSETVRIVNGLAITTVQWEEAGGMIVNFKVMAIQVPQIRADIDNRCGIVHGTK